MNIISEFQKINYNNLKYLNVLNQHKLLTGKNVKIAIIDGAPYPNYILGLTPVNYKNDKHWHGTTVGLIIKSIAPDVQLYGIGIWEGKENWNFDQAISWCIDNNINIINISMSIMRSNKKTELIKYAYSKGNKIVIKSYKML